MRELKRMLDEGRIIEVGEHYMTDENVVIIRCYGKGTSLYWVREDDLYTAYNSLYYACEKMDWYGKDIRKMQMSTARNIVDSIRSYLAHRA